MPCDDPGLISHLRWVQVYFREAPAALDCFGLEVDAVNVLLADRLDFQTGVQDDRLPADSGAEADSD